MKRLIVALALTLFLAGCTRPDATKQFLENQGYTDVQITGYKAFSCADSDDFSTGFTAKNTNGKTVSGTVCEGIMKSKTIRFD